MAIGRRKPKQQVIWVAQHEIAAANRHPFYPRLNRLLAGDGFDQWVEELCSSYFADGGRPSIPPGVYFRMLFLGYMEGFQSERAIAWHCQDRMSLREFLGYQLHERTPDHSSFTVWRKRLPLDVYRAVFQRILAIMHRKGLIKAYATGVDSTTLEANASLRRLARKDSGASYAEYVKELMREAGEEPVDAAAVARFDRKRKGKKLSNKDWHSETDPDARIAKMKDGRTHLAYKSEHAVDLSTGAILAAEIHPGDCGDTASIEETLAAADENLSTLDEEDPPEVLCVVADKGYHQTELIRKLNQDEGFTTYIPEKDSPTRRRWRGDKDSCREYHANRHRCRGNEGKRLSRLRSWLVERSFAFIKRSGNLGRLTLRGMDNVAKRYMMHAVGHNLALIMRHLYGNGTPKGAADALRHALALLWCSILSLLAVLPPLWRWEDKTFSFPIHLESWPFLRQGHGRVS